jgi:hypothetical protein
LSLEVDTMRIRLSSEEPHLKAWYNVSNVTHISQLKKALCADLKALSDGATVASELDLLLDDFELLDESSIDVLREGDLVR